MGMIDVRTKFNDKKLASFLKGKAANAEAFMLSDAEDWLCVSTVSAIMTDMFKDEYAQHVKDDKNYTLTIMSGDDALLLTGYDYMWYKKSDKKKSTFIKNVCNALLELPPDAIINDEAKKSKAQKSDLQEQFHVAITYDKDNDLSVQPIVEDFKGKKTDCIVWLNNQIVRHRNEKNEVIMLFCLDYDNPDFEWHTLQELFELQKIDVL